MTPPLEASPGAQRAALVTAGLAGLALLACWGLAAMTGSLAVYAAAWVAAVSAASSAALVYRLWTVGRPDLQQRTQTMTLGLVGWLIVIGGCMTLFRAAASVFVEQELASMDWAAWLLPVALLLAAGAFGVCWRAAATFDDERLRLHGPQHLATAAALALAEAGIILSQLGDEVTRWSDVLAGVVVISVGMAWSWLRLWQRIGSRAGQDGEQPDPQDAADPAINAKARELLDTACRQGDIQNYDRLAIENDAAGTHITVRLHLDADQTLHAARERARTLERALESLLPAGTATALLEPAPAPPPPSTPTDTPPASPPPGAPASPDDPGPAPHDDEATTSP